MRKPVSGLSAAAEARLQSAPWPGNVRELRNAIERACIMSDGRVIGERDLDLAIGASPASAMPGPATTTLAQTEAPLHADPLLLSTAQRDQIQRVLRETKGNKAAAAKKLGVSRRSLYRWLDRLDIIE
jgi:two-component system NtrC family response regulator